MKLIISYPTDESLTIVAESEVTRQEIMSADHDADGWAGMTKVRDTAVRIAQAAGISVEIEGEPNV